MLSHSLGYLTGTQKSSCKYTRTSGNDLELGWKVRGSWWMESLHGWTLLGARGTGFVMFWGWESEEIVRGIDVEARNVSFLQFLSFNPIHLFFVWVFWSGTSSLVAVTAEDSFLYPSIRSRCLQRKSRRKRGDHWGRCRGSIWSCCWSVRGKSKIISIA